MPNPLQYGIQSPQIRGAAYFGDLAHQTLEDSIQRNNDIKLQTFLDSFLNPELAATPFDGSPTVPESPSARPPVTRKPPPLRSLFAPHEWAVMEKRRPDAVALDAMVGLQDNLERGDLNAATIRMLRTGMSPDAIMQQINQHRVMKIREPLDQALSGVQTKEEFNRVLAAKTSGLSSAERSQIILDYQRMGAELPDRKALVESKIGELSAQIHVAMADRPLTQLDNVITEALRSPEIQTLDPITKGQVANGLKSQRQIFTKTFRDMKQQEALEAIDPALTDFNGRLALAKTPQEARAAFSAIRATINEPSYRNVFDKSASPLLKDFLTGLRTSTSMDRRDFLNTMSIRAKAMQDPAYKSYATIIQQGDKMRLALREAKRDPSTRIAADQAIIMTFNRILDPESVVRESEYLRTEQNAALLNRLKAIAPRVMDGGATLLDEDRSALVGLANLMEQEARKRYDDFVVNQRSMAERFGADPEFAVPTITDYSADPSAEADRFLKRKGLGGP